MQYLGTSFSLVLGAWRLRFSVALEDAPDGPGETGPSRPRQHHLYACDDDGAFAGRRSAR